MKFHTPYLKPSQLLTRLSSVALSLFIIVLPWYIFPWSELKATVVSEILGSTMTAGFFIQVFLLLIVLHLFNSQPDKLLRINLIDYLVLLSGLLILGHWTFSGFYNIDPFLLIRITSIYCVYGLIRIAHIPGGGIIMACFICIFLQCLYGLYEYFQPMISYDFIPVKEINGSFFNSGPFGGYMALGIVLCIGILSKKPFKNLNWIMGVLGVPILICCILSESRAAWIAAITGVLYLIWKNYDYMIIKIWRYKPIFIGLISIVLGTIIFLLGNALYYYKEDSADGRFLIWENTVDMISDHPWLGLGPGQFAARYMQYQADNFQLFEDSPQSVLAGNTSYAFNEVLRIGVEYGLVGVLLLTFFVFMILSQEFRFNSTSFRGYNCIGQAVLMGFGVFSMFSYPCSVLPLLMIFVMITGKLSNGFNPVNPNLLKRSNKIFIPYIRYGLIVLLCIVTLYYTSFFKKMNNSYYAWHTSEMEFDKSDCQNESIISKLESAYPVLLNNGLYMSMFGRILTKCQYYKRAIPILDRACELEPTTQVYLDLGDAYKGISNPDSAKVNYLYALRMIPGRIKPYYKIAQLYRDLGRKEEMKKIINKYLHRKYIKRTLASYEYELEMKNWLEE